MEKKIKAAEDRCQELEIKMKAIEEMLGAEGYYDKTPKNEIEILLSRKQELDALLQQALEDLGKTQFITRDAFVRPIYCLFRPISSTLRLEKTFCP